MTASCPCCGGLRCGGAGGVRSHNDTLEQRGPHWVDADVLAIVNAAHAEAERRAAAEVELGHLLIVLTVSRAVADAFEAARIDVEVLHAVVSAATGVSRDRQQAPRTSSDLRHLLDLSQRTAAIYGSRVIGLQDLMATLLAAPASIDGAATLNRWYWAARAYPACSHAPVRAVVGATAPESTETTAAQAAARPAPVQLPAEDALPAVETAVDSKIVRLKARAVADAEDLCDDAPLDPGQEPDPELEQLGVKRYYLSLDDDIVCAPSIGPKTADRLRPHGITHVKHLLACEPERLSARVGARHLTASRIAAWKYQARLVCSIPWLRGMHAQLLVGAGYGSIEKIMSTDRLQVCAAVTQFATTRDGQSILRNSPPPELDRIMRWIENTQQAEPQRAQWGKSA